MANHVHCYPSAEHIERAFNRCVICGAYRPLEESGNHPTHSFGNSDHCENCGVEEYELGSDLECSGWYEQLMEYIGADDESEDNDGK
jgi:hypothetical protein